MMGVDSKGDISYKLRGQKVGGARGSCQYVISGRHKLTPIEYRLINHSKICLSLEWVDTGTYTCLAT